MPATFPLSQEEKRELAATREYPVNEVQDGFSEFLQRWRWDYFLTVSFRTPRQPFHALSTLQQVARVIKKRSNGRFFIGTELHLNRTLHVHGLYQSPTTPDGPTWVSGTVMAQYLWQDFFGLFGRSQVRKVRSREAVSSYCSKYVTKELTEWEFRL